MFNCLHYGGEGHYSVKEFHLQPLSFQESHYQPIKFEIFLNFLIGGLFKVKIDCDTRIVVNDFHEDKKELTH